MFIFEKKLSKICYFEFNITDKTRTSHKRKRAGIVFDRSSLHEKETASVNVKYREGDDKSYQMLRTLRLVGTVGS